jgi:hypothetical protein
MEIDKLKIDDDLVEYLSTKSDVNAFINECIRNKKKEDPVNIQSSKSDEALSEVKEAYPVFKKEKENGKDYQNKIIVTSIAFAIIMILLILITKTCNSPKPSSHTSVVDSVAVDSTLNSEDDTFSQQDTKVKKVWNFRTEKDEMTNTKDIWASITSDNSVDQDEPYGETDCNITIRYMKKWGYDAMIGISEGQIFGSEYDGENYVMVKFDNGKPIKYWFNEASDGSSESVFIDRKSDFIARCKKAKSIKVELPLYQGGRPVFDFSLDEPLKWKSK